MSLSIPSDLLPKSKRSLTFHISLREKQVWDSLPSEKKALIRAIVKYILQDPTILEESERLMKYFQLRALSPFICPICHVPFQSAQALKQHIRYGEFKSEVCPICAKHVSTKKGEIFQHLMKKHNIALPG
ncbi:hypothetical protein MJ1HA_0184 [Metallosphaera sedula]|nr:hypothetical protein MJ1HA_0184 [Metallosphaera sedula]